MGLWQTGGTLRWLRNDDRRRDLGRVPIGGCRVEVPASTDNPAPGEAVVVATLPPIAALPGTAFLGRAAMAVAAVETVGISLRADRQLRYRTGADGGGSGGSRRVVRMSGCVAISLAE
jgi:hypothetical protein